MKGGTWNEGAGGSAGNKEVANIVRSAGKMKRGVGCGVGRGGAGRCDEDDKYLYEHMGSKKIGIVLVQ